MSKQEVKVLNYVIICIDEFAKQKKISRQEANIPTEEAMDISLY